MDINSFFKNMPIFIINLFDNIERRNHIEKEFGDYANYEFIEAVDGRNAINFQNKYNVNYKTNTNFSTALIAVICSHAKAIKTAYARDYENIIVFEDDVHLDLIPKCDFTINDVINTNDDWEIIQLYYVNKSMENYFREIANQKKLCIYKRNLGNFSGTCYMINRKGMKKFLESVVQVNEACTEFNILNSIIDPEETMFGFLDSYYISKPFIYYYFDSMSFESYTDSINDHKKYCQIVQKEAMNFIKSLFN